MSADRRCWWYLRGCRQPATNSIRIGDHAYHYCSNPDHRPRPGKDNR